MFRLQTMPPPSNWSTFVSCYLGESTWRPSSTVLYVLGFSLTLIPILALVLNIIEIIFVYKAPKLKKHTRVYLISVALCDILLGITVMPYKILGMIKEDHAMFSKLGCDIGNSIHVLLVTLMMWFLCALSFDRYIVSCKPFQTGYWSGRKHGWKLFVICFCGSVVLSFGSIMPNFHMRGLEPMQTCLTEQQRSCKLVTNIYYSVFLCVFAFLIPSTGIGLCNRQTIHAVSRRQQIFLKLANINTKRASYRRCYFGMTFSHTIVTMTTVCLVFMLPYFILTVIDPWISFRIPDVIWLAITWLLFAKSLINPLLYLHGTKILRFRAFLCSRTIMV